MANDHKGSSGNLGDPVVSIEHGGRRYRLPTPIDPRLRVRGRGDEQRTQRWYRQAKETKRGEMGVRECMTTQTVEAERARGTPSREEVPSHEPLREACQVHCDLNHVHVTTTDLAGTANS